MPTKPRVDPSSQADWLNLAAQLDRAYACYQDMTTAPHLVRAPGRPSSNGRRADGFEGFSRLSLLRAFLHRAGHPADLNLLTDALSIGLTQNQWPAIGDYSQSIVDSAGLGLALRIIGLDYLNAMPQQIKVALAEHLRPALTAHTSNNNWHMFKYVIAATLEVLEGETPASSAVLRNVPEIIEGWHLGRGWYSDGPGRRIDYYNSWAFHFYPELEWHLSRDQGQPNLLVPDLHRRSTQFAEDLSHLIGPDGTPIITGRSLIYRYGVATAFATNLLVSETGLAAGNAATDANRVLGFFTARGQVPGNPKSAGWTLRTAQVAQNYSGPAASLWAAKVFARLLIPASHPSWQVESTTNQITHQPGPIVLAEAGLLIADGHAFNHGIGSRKPSLQLASNLYDQLTFSDQTVPMRQHRRLDHAFQLTSSTLIATRSPDQPTGHGKTWIASRDTVTIGKRPQWFQRAITATQVFKPRSALVLELQPELWSITMQLSCGQLLQVHRLSPLESFRSLWYYLPRTNSRQLQIVGGRISQPRFMQILGLSHRNLDGIPVRRSGARLGLHRYRESGVWLLEHDSSHSLTITKHGTYKKFLEFMCCGHPGGVSLTEQGLRPD